MSDAGHIGDQGVRCAILNGDRAGDAMELKPGEYRIGRSRANDVRINDRRVARENHALIRVQGEVWLTPGDAERAVLLNGEPVTGEVSLQQGDVVSLNGVEMAIEVPGRESAATSPSKRRHAEPTGSLPDVSGVQAVPAAERTAPAQRAAPAPAEPAYGRTMTFVRPAARGTSDSGGTMRAQANPPTQMMSNQDFKSMDKPLSGESKRGKPVWVTLLVVGLVLGALFLFRGPEEEEGLPALNASHVQHEFGFRMHYPNRWRFAQTDRTVRIVENASDPGAGTVIEATFDRRPEYLYLGLRAGFERLMAEHRAARPAWRVAQHRPFRWPGGLAILYEFAEDDARGRGFFMLNHSDRIVLECHTPVTQAARYNDFINNALRSSGFTAGQDVVDYALPTTELRAYALSNPADLEARALQQYRRAQELVRRRDVDPSNLYAALKLCEDSIQALSVLPDRDASFREVFHQLRDTSRLLNDAIRDAEFRIRYEERANNRQQLRIELQRFLRLLPDEEDPRNQRVRARLSALR